MPLAYSVTGPPLFIGRGIFMTIGKILLLGFTVSLIMSMFIIVIFRTNCPPCDEPWVAGDKPDSLDHGPYIRQEPVKIDGKSVNKAIEQQVSLVCGEDHLSTWVWHNGNVIGHFVAMEYGSRHGQAGLDNYWWVREINDSVKLAHRDMGFKILEKYTKFPK